MIQGKVDRRQGIQSLEIGIGVFDAVVRAQRPLRLMEVAENTGLSPSKTRMYLISLIRTGMVEQNASTNAYSFGPRASRLGLEALRSDDLLLSAEQLVSALATETGNPVLLSAWSEDHSVIVYASDTTSALPITFRVGRSTSLTDTATGKAFLAYKKEADVAGALSLLGIDTLSESFRSDLDEIRRRGYALSKVIHLQPGVTLTGFGALAAPIFANNGDVRYVITVLYRSTDGLPMIKLLAEKIRSRSRV